jgi:hypothetical protein
MAQYPGVRPHAMINVYHDDVSHFPKLVSPLREL